MDIMKSQLAEIGEAIAQAERSLPPVRLIGRDEISNMVEILEGMVGRS